MPEGLTEEEIQIDLESHIKFEEPILEVKRIKKNVYIDQCKVIVTKYHPFCSIGKLFISGYVRKNIEYATKDCRAKDLTVGDIRHLTCKVPFNCVADIQFKIAQPVMSWPIRQEQYEILGEDCSCKCNTVLLGKKDCEDLFINREEVMEPIYCEFEGAKIIEVDLHDDYMHRELYSEITEKMAAFIRVKILQKQQVKGFDGGIPRIEGNDGREEFAESEDDTY